MDDRVRKHAEVLVDWSARAEGGEGEAVAVLETDSATVLVFP